MDRLTLVLVERSADLGRHPGPAEFVAGAGRLHAAGLLTDAELGRALAEVPAWFMGLGPRPEGGAFVLHLPDDPDTGVLFTTKAAVEAFMARHGLGPSAAPGGAATPGVEAVGRFSRWFASPLSIMEEGFTRVLVDPAPDGTGGCRLEREALVEAIRHLHGVLRPRLAGFLWSAR